MASSIASNLEDGPRIITQFPQELLASISSLLPNSDIKNLRLTCSRFRSAVCLRIERLFLSPNPLNIEVFRAVADHQDFRQQVTTIVYDDARLRKPLETEEELEYSGIFAPATRMPAGVPLWFGRNYHKICFVLHRYGKLEVERPDHLEVARKLKAKLSPVESYKLYQQLEEQQKHVIRHNLDAKALEYGLARFPRLRSIILTPAAHGIPLFPLYKTPMIRSLPEGFIYPIPRGWPMPELRNADGPAVEAWVGDDVKDKWRGFCLVTRVLAHHQRQHQNRLNTISEFRVESNELSMGLNARIFDEPDNNEYKDLVSLFSRPDMTRIDLALSVRGQDNEEWKSFNSGYLRRCLSNAANLKHFSVSTDLVTHAWAQQRFIPLGNLFPINKWTQLRHFGISKFCVLQDDLISFLAALPPTLRSVELSFLFFGPEGNYRDLLRAMRGKLGWRKKPVSERPRLSMKVPSVYQPGRVIIDLDLDVNEFLYSDGKNPFGPEDRKSDMAFPGSGIERYLFNPEKDRPYLEDWDLVKLGFLTKEGNPSGPPTK
ncbi:hypothetical protein EDB81DRAFT_913850 [Dactylonectria macrodidyma]|uniref:F-box domain-containing protein n=1 Tax=Dactylonectria macrodidyma TaxID=307937 RepID=A0A9P9IIA7_9HYPO|nr:hypothetical protein EDB81DRAFT_913850 [Dactylonectria macrodidyma]